MLVYKVKGRVAAALNAALHRWCRKNRWSRNGWRDPHPRVLDGDGHVAAEKPDGTWLIYSSADVPKNVIRWAAKDLEHLLGLPSFVARRRVRGALAKSCARIMDEVPA